MFKDKDAYSHEYRTSQFYESALDVVFQKKQKQLFLMDGTIGMGKTSRWVVDGGVTLALSARPVKIGNRWVRDTRWVTFRESVANAEKTMIHALTSSVFSPEALTELGYIKVTGKFPRIITINLPLEDDTYLNMSIWCYGFSSPIYLDTLRSHEFTGGMLPECQGYSFDFAKLACQRSGRYKTRQTVLERIIEGKRHLLTGVTDTKIVLADCNIPPRPHDLYDNIYDNEYLESSVYEVITPPAPLIPVPTRTLKNDIEKLKKDNKYTITRFEGEETLWMPNTEAYEMTRHYERALVDNDGELAYDENGQLKTEPFSGYDYWLGEVTKMTDSEVNRYVLGRKSNTTGGTAVYKTFEQDTHIGVMDVLDDEIIYVGFDQGNYAAFIFMQYNSELETLYIFDELIFTADDKIKTRGQITNHLKPMINNRYSNYTCYVVPDPDAFRDTSLGEGGAAILIEQGLNVMPCATFNQNVKDRINNLGYFIDAGKLKVHPSCKTLIAALSGNYQWNVDTRGYVKDTINKNESSHPAEAAQYPAVNIYARFIAPTKQDKRKKNHENIVSSKTNYSKSPRFTQRRSGFKATRRSSRLFR